MYVHVYDWICFVGVYVEREREMKKKGGYVLLATCRVLHFESERFPNR